MKLDTKLSYKKGSVLSKCKRKANLQKLVAGTSCGVPKNYCRHGKARLRLRYTRHRHTGTTKVMLQDASFYVRNEIISICNEALSSLSTERHYRKFFPTIFQTICLKMLSRRCQVIIFRLQAGHCKLMGRLHKIDAVDSPLCPNCLTEETVSHFVLFCSRFQAERSYSIEFV